MLGVNSFACTEPGHLHREVSLCQVGYLYARPTVPGLSGFESLPTFWGPPTPVPLAERKEACARPLQPSLTPETDLLCNQSSGMFFLLNAGLKSSNRRDTEMYL